MNLPTRHESKTVPSYSLTADLLSYLRCGLQYRYQNGSALPPARPVQLWFGEFIHGTMEMAFTLWKERKTPLPWPSTRIDWEDRENGLGLPEHDIGEIGRRVEAVLAVQGKMARSGDARRTAYTRVEAAINLIGPHLFPLVVFAEQALEGSRELSALSGGQMLRADRYSVTGVADVLTNISLDSVPPDNLIRRAIELELAKQNVKLPSAFEVIVDYKGAARPPVGTTAADYWQQHEWQIQMYAWLRARKVGALPVVAGIVLYVNELLPSATDVAKMQRQMQTKKTDVYPDRGSPDYYALTTARPGAAADRALTEAFRIQRAIRVIPVTGASMEAAGSAFDGVVAEIENRIATEVACGDINGAWMPSCNDPDTCVACDSRYFCSQPAGTQPGQLIEPPHAP